MLTEENQVNTEKWRNDSDMGKLSEDREKME